MTIEVMIQVLNTPGIYMIETIDSEKIASAVNASWEKVIKPNKEPLKVLVQVNTSSEEGSHYTFCNLSTVIYCLNCRKEWYRSHKGHSSV